MPTVPDERLDISDEVLANMLEDAEAERDTTAMHVFNAHHRDSTADEGIQCELSARLAKEIRIVRVIRAVIAARALERQWEREESALRKSPDGDGMDEACADGIADCRAELAAILSAPGAREGGNDG